MVTLSPQLGGFLTKATQIPDLETALWKVLLEYLELKREALRKQVAQFEGKWEMSFEEFSRQCREGSLQADPYSWEVEQDFWAWEQAVTLLRHCLANFKDDVWPKTLITTCLRGLKNTC